MQNLVGENWHENRVRHRHQTHQSQQQQDVAHRRWSSEVARIAGIPESWLPELFESQEYLQLARLHAQLIELAGVPAFHVSLGDGHETAPSFEALRTAVLTVAQRGIKLQRFKGLGEMNADQLGETTMSPSTRMLAQVTLEDAAVADRVFSKLMGDQVEPRREFIEENARAVANLDV